MVIAVSALMGLHILAFFGISVASFQVGGGLLLMTSALAMLNAQPAEAKSNEEELHAAAARASTAVVALTTALCFLLAQPSARVQLRPGHPAGRYAPAFY